MNYDFTTKRPLRKRFSKYNITTILTDYNPSFFQNIQV